VFGGDQASWVTAAALMGGTLAATSHAAKLTTRASANASPEPFSNIALSLFGDGAVPVMLWLSWVHPLVALVVLAAVVVVSLVVVWVLWRFIARLLRRMRGGQIAPALER
jgi:membrane protein YdbS with pleckstrin-like domain